jgi:ribosomal protein L11 methyltransferase
MIPYNRLYIYEIDGKTPYGDNAFPPDYIGTWWEGDHAFLFFHQERGDFVRSILKREPSFHLIDTFTMDYRDWQGGDEIGPLRVGDLVFTPPWDPVHLSDNQVSVLLDPSVVFGTGRHATTRCCLEAVCRVYEKDQPRRVSDLGTGTGILALACAKLGAERILAVDHNPLAVNTALRNVALNGEERRIVVAGGKAEDFIWEDGDLICCNLYREVIDRLLSTEAFFQKRWSILSGFFESDLESILQRLRRRGVHPEIISHHGPWPTIVGLKERTLA